MRFVLILIFAVLALSHGAKALVGGSIKERPDIVVLSHLNGFCSATLIGRGILLTAAHCVKRGQNQAVHIGGHFYHVRETQIHPQYRQDDWQNGKTAIDIALVKFAGFASDKQNLSASLAKPGETLTLYGFGPTKMGSQETGKLSTLNLTVTGSPSRFQIRLKGNGGACKGDSGGAAYSANGALVGVISWASGSNPQKCGDLTGLTPVAPHLAWIYTVLQKWGEE